MLPDGTFPVATGLTGIDEMPGKTCLMLIDPDQRNRMVVYPASVDYRVSDRDAFRCMLTDIGFVDGNEPGSNFMKWLTFIGCSPSMGSNQDYNNYSVELVMMGDAPVLLTSARHPAPACPACGHRNTGEAAASNIVLSDSMYTWLCNSCGRKTSIAEINWRHKLAIAVDYIVIHGVFEGEVVPADGLLDQLAEISGTSWSYCYC